jgi:hypothetical protein
MANSIRTSELPLIRFAWHAFGLVGPLLLSLRFGGKGRLAPMAAHLVDRLAILVAVCRFPCMGASNSRSLRFDSYVCMQHFVRRTTYVPFRRFLEDVR